MNLLHSARLEGVFIPTLLLKVLGVFFLVVPILDLVMAYALFGRNGDGYARFILKLLPTLVGGIGLLIPNSWANLFSSFALFGSGLWMLLGYGLVWSNYLYLVSVTLYLTPLPLTLWIRAKYTKLQSRTANAN